MDKILPIVKDALLLIFGNVVTIFVLISKYIATFVMNGGKSEEQIIEAHKEDQQTFFSKISRSGY